MENTSRHGAQAAADIESTHPEGGYEVILLYVACLVALVVGGSGPFAVDGLIAKRLDARTRTSRIPTAAVR